MKMMASLENFLRTGRFGLVCLGTTSRSLTELLGYPDDRSVEEPEIRKYGNLEIVFRDGLVHMIALYFRDGNFISPFSFSDYCPNDQTSLSDMEHFLRTNQISYSPEESLTFDSQSGLRISVSNATLVFSQGRLYGIFVSAWDRPNPSTA
jgi:hypothetical protein